MNERNPDGSVKTDLTSDHATRNPDGSTRTTGARNPDGSARTLGTTDRPLNENGGRNQDGDLLDGTGRRALGRDMPRDLDARRQPRGSVEARTADMLQQENDRKVGELRKQQEADGSAPNFERGALPVTGTVSAGVEPHTTVGATTAGSEGIPQSGDVASRDDSDLTRRENESEEDHRARTANR